METVQESPLHWLDRYKNEHIRIPQDEIDLNQILVYLNLYKPEEFDIYQIELSYQKIVSIQESSIYNNYFLKQFYYTVDAIMGYNGFYMDHFLSKPQLFIKRLAEESIPFYVIFMNEIERMQDYFSTATPRTIADYFYARIQGLYYWKPIVYQYHLEMQKIFEHIPPVASDVEKMIEIAYYIFKHAIVSDQYAFHYGNPAKVVNIKEDDIKYCRKIISTCRKLNHIDEIEYLEQLRKTKPYIFERSVRVPMVVDDLIDLLIAKSYYTLSKKFIQETI